MGERPGPGPVLEATHESQLSAGLLFILCRALLQRSIARPDGSDRLNDDAHHQQAQSVLEGRTQPPALIKEDRAHQRQGDALSKQGDQTRHQRDPLKCRGRLIPSHQQIEAAQRHHEGRNRTQRAINNSALLPCCWSRMFF